MQIGYRSEIGHVRRRNEDALLVPEKVRPDGPVIVGVADGLGGHPAGDVASRLAVEALAKELDAAEPTPDPEAVLTSALAVAHSAVSDAAAADPALDGMGTTAVVAWVAPEQAWVVHVGDSRAYFVRHQEARPITEDHSRHGFLVQALGLGPDIRPDCVRLDLSSGDRLLLCTDGLTGLVPDSALGPLAASGGPQQAADRLVHAALDAGGHDNVTVVVVEV